MNVTQSQPQTAAQRQAAHRARRQHDSKRLNLYIPEDAGRALERLARHQGVTQAEVIAALVLAQDAAVAAAVPDDQIDTYYGVTR